MPIYCVLAVRKRRQQLPSKSLKRNKSKKFTLFKLMRQNSQIKIKKWKNLQTVLDVFLHFNIKQICHKKHFRKRNKLLKGKLPNKEMKSPN